MDARADAPAIPELNTTLLASNGQHVVEETDELVTASLAAMRKNLAASPAWAGAPIPTDDFLLMFLRSEVFVPGSAADRYRKFWKAKVTLCGEDKAALPIRGEDVAEGLNLEFFMTIPGSRDIEGRQVVLVNPAKNSKSVDTKLRIRGVWYTLLAALEDVENQKRGFCFIIPLKTYSITQLDRPFTKMVSHSLAGVLPVRIGSMNICYPPSFFRLVWAIMHPVLEKRVKKRVRVIGGSDAAILEGLSAIVEPQHVPPPMGSKEVDFKGWLSQRIRAEA